ncbi:MAG TPA: dolichyl-phosphate beta-glucosyltransferase [Chloroflexota bacterium]|nr:dolichyl-phosphate beta-glucosyltransferase [Chloroflexota bacterium]
MPAPFVSIVIPAFNEAERLPATLAQLGQFLGGEAYPAEIVVVDDGSTDRTVAVAEQAAAADPRVRVLRAPHRGKGAAVRRGMLEAQGAVRVMCDADLSMPAHELPKLLAPLAAGADVALATREGAGARRIGEPYLRHLMGRVFNTLVRLLAVPGLHDTQCGFKAFTAASAVALFGASTVDGFGFDVEVLYLARKRGLRLVEVPIAWYYQASSRVSPLRDTIRMIRDVLRVRWNDARGVYPC